MPFVFHRFLIVCELQSQERHAKPTHLTNSLKSSGLGKASGRDLRCDESSPNLDTSLVHCGSPQEMCRTNKFTHTKYQYMMLQSLYCYTTCALTKTVAESFGG